MLLQGVVGVGGSEGNRRVRGCEHRSMASCCVLQGILGKWQGQYFSHVDYKLNSLLLY